MQKYIYSAVLIVLSFLAYKFYLIIPDDGAYNLIIFIASILIATSAVFSICVNNKISFSKSLIGNNEFRKKQSNIIILAVSLLSLGMISPLYWLYYGRMDIWHFIYNFVSFSVGFFSILFMTFLPKIKNESHNAAVITETAVCFTVLILEAYYQYHEYQEAMLKVPLAPYFNLVYNIVITISVSTALTYGFAAFRGNHILPVRIKGKTIDPFILLLAPICVFALLYAISSVFIPFPLGNANLIIAVFMLCIAFLSIERFTNYTKKTYYSVIINTVILLSILLVLSLYGNKLFLLDFRGMWDRYFIGFGVCTLYSLIIMSRNVRTFFEDK